MKNLPLYEVRRIENLKDMLESSAALFGNKPAFLYKPKGESEYKPILYSQFKEDVDSFGTALINLGLKGKRIALIGENRYEWTVSYLAVVNGTGVIVPLDKELPENEIESLLKRSMADAIIFSGAKGDEIRNIDRKGTSVRYFIDMDADEHSEDTLSFWQLISQGREMLKNGDRSFISAEIDSEGMSILLFTSGTTDFSKAVMLSHKNITSNLMAMCSMLYIDEKDTFLSILPIHHTYECTCGFLCPIYRGCTVAFCEGLRHILKNLHEAKVTIMLGVPLIFETMYRRIWEQAGKKPGLKSKLKLGLFLSKLLKKFGIDVTKKLFAPIHESFGGHIRILISGAAGIDPHVAKGFRDLGIHFVQGYGLTECSPIVTLNRDLDFKDDAAGIPLPNLQVRIDNPDSEGIGEIVVKGPSVMLGYYGDNQDITKEAFKDGWFLTGDLGYIDRDGFIHITGRKKNVIVTKNGKNIFPEEIETLLNRLEYVKESMVYGKYDQESDDMVVMAEIVLDTEKLQEDFGNEPLSLDTVGSIIKDGIKSINSKLVNYKHIKGFTIRETEFAKTTTKKIKRYVEQRR